MLERVKDAARFTGSKMKEGAIATKEASLDVRDAAQEKHAQFKEWRAEKQAEKEKEAEAAQAAGKESDPQKE
ncbi:hypothetical protein V3C99_018518 [Haemonchus contortus]